MVSKKKVHQNEHCGKVMEVRARLVSGEEAVGIPFRDRAAVDGVGVIPLRKRNIRHVPVCKRGEHRKTRNECCFPTLNQGQWSGDYETLLFNCTQTGCSSPRIHHQVVTNSTLVARQRVDLCNGPIFRKLEIGDTAILVNESLCDGVEVALDDVGRVHLDGRTQRNGGRYRYFQLPLNLRCKLGHDGLSFLFFLEDPFFFNLDRFPGAICNAKDHRKDANYHNKPSTRHSLSSLLKG